jgi:hypothetical protein
MTPEEPSYEIFKDIIIMDSTAIPVNGGINSPYGLVGIESVVDHGDYDFNFGVGIGAGFMAGIGSRLHFLRGECFYLANCTDSIFIGVHLTHSTSHALTKVDDNETEYKIPENDYVYINVGDKTVLFEKIALSLRLGHKQPLRNKKADYVSGTENDDMKEAANSSLKAGTEFSVSLLYRF